MKETKKIEQAWDEKMNDLHNGKTSLKGGWGEDGGRIKLQNVGSACKLHNSVSCRGSKNVITYVGHTHQGQHVI